MNKKSQNPQDPYVINFRHIHGDEQGGHCGYCDKSNSKTVGFSCELMKPEIYKELIDSGWRRCGTYYYKPNIDESCCSWYTIRMKAKDYVIRKSHKKLLRKFENLIYGVMSKNDKSQNKGEQQIKKEIVPEIKQNSVSQHEQADLDKLKTLILDFLKTYNLKQYFEQNDMANKDQNLDLKSIVDQLKVMISNNMKKGNYFSNFWMLLFGKNKSYFKCKQNDFIINTQYIILDYFTSQNEDFIPVVENNGFVTFFIKENQNKAQKKLQKQSSKGNLIDEEYKIDENLQNKKNQKFEQDQNSQEIDPLQKLKQNDVFTPTFIKKGRLQIKLIKAEQNALNLKMYQNYSSVIHQKNGETAAGLKRFLCMQALEFRDQNGLQLGCWHMNYYIDDKFVAVGVVDIMADVMSSVYFFYDPDYKDWNLGTISSIIEIQYVQQLQKMYPQFQYYYMGYYIQSTNKMVYKGEFEPSYLLCPETYTWVLLDDQLRKLIDTDIDRKKKTKSARLAPKEAKCNPRIIKDPKQLQKFVENQTQISIQRQQIPFKILDQQYFNGQLNESFVRVCSGIYNDVYPKLHFGYVQ